MRAARVAACVGAVAFAAGCSESYAYKGADGAIDHCKNMTTGKVSWSSYHTFSQLDAYDMGDDMWVVTGRVEFDSVSGVPGVRQVRCEVFFDKGFSDDASVRVDLNLP